MTLRNASRLVECNFLTPVPGCIEQVPSWLDECITTTAASPLIAPGCGPFAAQSTAEIRFSEASDEPRSDDRCEPTSAILPGGAVPSPDQAKHIAAEVMCSVSVPWVITTPSQPESKAC